LYAINWHQDIRPATKGKKARERAQRTDKKQMKPTKEEMTLFNTCYSADTEFSAAARLLQSKWREKKDYKQGKLGNYLEEEFAKKSKANFLTENAKKIVTESISEVRECKGLISEPRIWNNLLSSQPLCFNLFSDLSRDLNMATKFFCELFPNRISEVTSIKFEYSPGRRDLKYLGDNSAFDVFVKYNFNGYPGFIGIEVKYAESLNEETEEKAERNYKERYSELTTQKHFKTDSISALRKPPIAQIWRDHLLSIATMQDYDSGFFVFLFPSRNINCQKGVEKYVSFLASPKEEITGFYPRHLDDFITTLHKLYKAEWTEELLERYLGIRN
jgi:hypothetical protein